MPIISESGRETGESEVPGYSQLRKEFKARLDYMRLFQKKKKWQNINTFRAWQPYIFHSVLLAC